MPGAWAKGTLARSPVRKHPMAAATQVATSTGPHSSSGIAGKKGSAAEPTLAHRVLGFTKII